MFGFIRRPWFWIMIVVLALGAGGVWFLGQQAKAEKARQEAAVKNAPPSPYAAVANGKADVEGGIVSIAARSAGVVRTVYVQEGDRVTSGQVLARQEDDQQRLQVQRAAAEVRQASAALQATLVEIRTAEREYERLQKLAPSNFVAGQKLDQARDAIDAAKAKLAAQQAAVSTSRARLSEAQYNLELTVIRAPMSGVIVRRYANPGAGASTLNVSNMFDLEPDAPRIVRAEIVEASIPAISVGQEVEIVPEADETKLYVGRVLRRAAMFGARRLQSDDPSERTDERVVEVVVSADNAPLLIGQRVLVKFMKPGERAGVRRGAPAASAARKK